jgi:hypothetical protein
MPQFRADFGVKGDLVFPQSVPLADLAFVGCTVRLRNDAPADDGHVEGLVATVIGPCDSLDSAPDELRDVLVEWLDALSFATHSRFEVVGCRRAIEWEPGLRQRRMIVMQHFDPRFPPAPELDAERFSPALALAAANLPGYLKGALRSFRYGCIDRQLDSQFSRYWAAFEVVAENNKETAQVPITCPSCRASLRCDACGELAVRTPMAKQAIEALTAVLRPHDYGELLRRLFKVRNGLTHGRSVHSIEAEIKCPLAQCIDEVALLAWHAILRAAKPYLGDDVGQFSSFGTFVVGELTPRMLLEVEQRSEGDHPTEGELPQTSISMQTRFGPQPKQQPE